MDWPYETYEYSGPPPWWEDWGTVYWYKAQWCPSEEDWVLGLRWPVYNYG